MTKYHGYNWDNVYTAMASLVEGIENAASVKEIGQVEAGKPDNISLHPGDTVLIALGKINKIDVLSSGVRRAHIKGYFLIYVEGRDETAQKRASYLWDRLAASVEANSTLGIDYCKCKVDYNNPGGFRENDRNMGASNTPDLCAGSILVVDIIKTREWITIP